MRTMVTLAMAAMALAGTLPVHEAMAETKTPAHVVVEVKVSAAADAAYRKEFADFVRPLIEKESGRYLVRSGKSDTIEGTERTELMP